MSDKNSFDPILFLGLHLDPELKDRASKELMEQIGEYLVVRTLELLDEEKIKNLDSTQKLFELAQQEIPDFNLKIKSFLNEFKQKYIEQIGNLK